MSTVILTNRLSRTLKEGGLRPCTEHIVQPDLSNPAAKLSTLKTNHCVTRRSCKDQLMTQTFTVY